VRRITFSAGNQPPVAVIQATPTSGAAPLSVTFDGSASNDADPGDQLTYKWDLNADGQFGDSTLKCCPAFTYPVGTHKVQLRVTDKSVLQVPLPW
jgi:PKD repeat protein